MRPDDRSPDTRVFDAINLNGHVAVAEAIYLSSRGDYTVYRFNRKVYVVKHFPPLTLGYNVTAL